MNGLEGADAALLPQQWFLIEAPSGRALWVREMAHDAPKTTVVMLPSLGRGVLDFDQLAISVWAAGHRVVLVQPHGWGPPDDPLRQKAGTSRPSTLDGIADDVSAAAGWDGRRPVVLLGHAFGNRVTRMTAARHPDLVSKLILLACGGHTPISPAIFEAMIGSMDQSLPRETQLRHLQAAFFAPGNDPSVWLDGWRMDIAGEQAAAVRATPRGDWELGGGKPMTILQAEFDAIAPEANALELRSRLGGQVEIVRIPNAGHAMLPEQPDWVARAVIAALGD